MILSRRILKHTNAGFTLIELIVVIAIAAILASIALPAMSHFIKTQRVNNNADQMLALFQYARSEAIRTNKPVLICPTVIRQSVATNYACNQFANYNDGTGWQGLFAFNDVNLNGEYDSGNDTPVRVVALSQNTTDAAKVKVKLAWGICGSNQQNQNCKTSITGDKKLAFLPNGQFGIGNGNNANDWTIGQLSLAFSVTDSADNNIMRRLIILPSGKSIICLKNNDNINLCNAPMS